MKFNKIALASLLCVAGSAFAATAPKVVPLPVQCDKTTPLSFVKTCAPEITFFVAGSSALGGSLSTILTSTSAGVGGYFDTSSVPVITVFDTGTPNGISIANPTNSPPTKAGDGVSAWYGMSAKELTGGVSVPMLIVYNSYMGSAAGVSALLAADLKAVPEADVVTVGPVLSTATKVLVANDKCVAVPDGGVAVVGNTTKVITAASTKVLCSSHAPTRADIAISDVDVPELAAVYATAAKADLKKVTRAPLAMQGFAVAVNNKFYDALQAQQLPSCAAGTYTEACQPSISRAQYASLVTKEGNIKSAAGFIPGDSTPLVLARRDQLSGTQATSNIYFAGTVCSKTGALTPIRQDDTVPGSLIVHENVQTADVENDLKANTFNFGTIVTPNVKDIYSIGVLALSKGGTSGSSYKFVKLDGVSPNFAKGGASVLTGGNLRNNMVDGSWGLQMVAYAAYTTATAAGSYTASTPKAPLINHLVSDLSNASFYDLSAIGFFNGTGNYAGRQTKVSRVAGNNCSPLITRTN